MIDSMLCAAIDIGSNTTRVLVAEPQEGQLRKVMEQRAYTRIDKALEAQGADHRREGRRGRRGGRDPGAARRGARRRGDPDRRDGGDPRGDERRAWSRSEIGEAAGVEVEVLSEQEEGRLAFIGATKTLGHPVEGDVGVVDVGGGSSEVILGTVADGRSRGALVQDRLRRARRRVPDQGPAVGGGDPQGPRPHRRLLRGRRDRAARPGGRGRRQRHLAAHAGRRRARVRDPRARRSGC